jgi:branched-chain amino acid transport system ATP-binding protein
MGDTTSAILEVTDLTVGYGGVAIARDIDLRVGAREVLALLGPNGAGKTTLLLTLAGLLPAIGGTVTVDGQPLRSGSARRANAQGVVLVPDTRALFTQLSPLENLQLAAGRRRPIDAVLDLFPSLRMRAHVPAGALSGGEQQMLAVARALVQQPKVLLIDEMSMGLAPVIVEGLVPVVRDAAAEHGAGVVLVEQHVHLALAAADRAIVLVHGEIALSGTADQIRSDPAALEAAYLGATSGSVGTGNN